MSSSKSHGAVPEKSYYSLIDAAAIAECKPHDLLHFAAQSKISLLAGVPDWVEIRIYDAMQNSISEPFLLKPDLLVLSQSQCLKIELNGRTQQSDYPAGYLLESNGHLKEILPSYGRRELNHKWAFWRTFQSDDVYLMTLISEQLFVLRKDLLELMQREVKVKAAQETAPKKKQKVNGSVSDVVDIPTKLATEASEISANAAHIDKEATQKNQPIGAVDARQTIDQQAKSLDDFPKGKTSIIRLKQVQTRTGLSRSAIYDRLDAKSPRYDPKFPKQISLGTGAVGWVESEIDTWLDAKISNTRNDLKQ